MPVLTQMCKISGQGYQAMKEEMQTKLKFHHCTGGFDVNRAHKSMQSKRGSIRTTEICLHLSLLSAGIKKHEPPCPAQLRNFIYRFFFFSGQICLPPKNIQISQILSEVKVWTSNLINNILPGYDLSNIKTTPTLQWPPTFCTASLTMSF